MRLAFVTSLLPSGRPDTGFEIATAAVIKAFRDGGAEVALFGILRPGEEPADAENAVVLARTDIENAVVGTGRKIGWLIGSARRGLPVIAAKIASFGAALDAAMERTGPFDAVIVNSAPVAAAYPGLFTRWPCLLVAHNVEHLSAEQNARATGGITALLYRREARLLEEAERRAVTAARHVFCLAEDDRAGFGVDIMAKSAVFPLLAPAPVAAAAGAATTHDIGMIGTWTWQPNLVGLRWFLDEVAPRLPASISVAIAGRHPDGLVSKHPNVSLLGRVPDAAAFVAGSRVIALASRSGTGVQLKTIETFQMGKPAVATPSSVRGIAELPMNCLVAEDPERFAAALVKLVNDVKAERTMPGDGRAFTEGQRTGMALAVRSALAALKTG